MDLDALGDVVQRVCSVHVHRVADFAFFNHEERLAVGRVEVSSLNGNGEFLAVNDEEGVDDHWLHKHLGVHTQGVHVRFTNEFGHSLLRIQPEVVGILRQRLVQDAFWTRKLFPEVQRLVLTHGEREGQVLIGRLQLEGSSRGVLPEGIDQDDFALAVLVVEVFEETRAGVESADFAFVVDQLADGTVVEITLVVDVSRAQGASDEAAILRRGEPRVVVAFCFGDHADGAVETVTSIHFHGLLVAQEVAIAWDEQRTVVLGSPKHAGTCAVRHAIELRHVVATVDFKVGFACVVGAVNATIASHVHRAIVGVHNLMHVGVHKHVGERKIRRHGGLFGLLVGA